MSTRRRLRVLQIGKFYPPHMGGVETHLQALCEGLAASVDVEVIVANDRRTSVEESVNGISVSRLGTAFYLSTVPVCPGMVRRIRRTPADLVHVHWPSPAALFAYLASRHTARLVMTYHSDIVRQRVWRRIFQPFLRRALDRAGALIVSSAEYVATSPILSEYRERCRVIPFGIRAERFLEKRDEEVKAIRKRYGPRIVLGVGRLVYYKGFEYLIRAMARIDGRLLIVGDGPLRAKLERQAIVEGVGDRVVLLGQVERLEAYYHAADVFVLPSVTRAEAFGMVQLEAMACGRAVVNTRLDSGVPSVSEDRVTGLTVPPENPAALAEAINRLLNDPEWRRKLGSAGQRRVQEEFSVEAMLSRTLRLYDEIMNGKTRPS